MRLQQERWPLRRVLVKQLVKGGQGASRASTAKDNGLFWAWFGDLYVKAAALPQINLNCACRTDQSEAFCLILPLKCWFKEITCLLHTWGQTLLLATPHSYSSFWGELCPSPSGAFSHVSGLLFSHSFPPSICFHKKNIPVIAKSHTSKVYQYFGRDITNILAMESIRGSKLAGYLMDKSVYFFPLLPSLLLNFSKVKLTLNSRDTQFLSCPPFLLLYIYKNLKFIDNIYFFNMYNTSFKNKVKTIFLL